jgi:hypothetical protein
MAYYQIVAIDTLRSLAYTSISGSYAAVGSALTHPVRAICITNATNGDMFFSDDGTNNKLFIAANSYKLYDLNSNRDGGVNECFKFPIGTQFYVKQSSAPSSGTVFIECLYAKGE